MPEPSFTPYLIAIIFVAILMVVFFLLPPDKPHHPDCGKK